MHDPEVHEKEVRKETVKSFAKENLERSVKINPIEVACYQEAHLLSTSTPFPWCDTEEREERDILSLPSSRIRLPIGPNTKNNVQEKMRGNPTMGCLRIQRVFTTSAIFLLFQKEKHQTRNLSCFNRHDGN